VHNIIKKEEEDENKYLEGSTRDIPPEKRIK